MKVKIYIVLFGAFLGVCATAGAEKTSPADSLVFSECTIDAVPGTVGSWIELYNRADEEVSAGGMRIVHNGRVIFTFPGKASIPPHWIVLVRFQSEKKSGRPRSEKGPEWMQEDPRPPKSFTETTDRKAQHPQSPADRKPGYLALYGSGDLSEKHLVDFLCWSPDPHDDFKPVKRLETRNASVLDWADENNLWQEKTSIFVGANTVGGTPPYVVPHPPSVLYRLGFAEKFAGEGSWTVLAKRGATPGKGNPWPAPSVSFSSAYLTWNFCPGVSRALLHARFPALARAVDGVGEWRYPKTEVAIGRVQIARTPHFNDIIWEGKIPQIATVGFETLKGDHGCYGRIRLEGERTTSDWRGPVWYRYHHLHKDAFQAKKWNSLAWILKNKMQALEERGRKGGEKWKQAKRRYEKTRAGVKAIRNTTTPQWKVGRAHQEVEQLKSRLKNLQEKGLKGSSEEGQCRKKYEKAKQKLDKLEQALEKAEKKVDEIEKAIGVGPPDIEFD